MIITIDPNAGFCWGVVKTIEIVENTLESFKNKEVYVLGQIIHNPAEIKRLEKKSLKVVKYNELEEINSKNSVVIIRAHGEPPQTYEKLNQLNINYIDATCPLVKALQDRVRKYYLEGYQIIIFGKKEHAEVIGLRGVCNDECFVVQTPEEAIEVINKEKKILLISQTTMDKLKYYKIRDAIINYLQENGLNGVSDRFVFKDSICHFVANRESELEKFARENDIIIFVAGKNSSNGKSLFELCKKVNSNSFFIENYEELDLNKLKNANKIGITGATSTPLWLLNFIKEKIEMDLN